MARRILLVEDDPQVCRLIEAFLKPEDLSIAVAHGTQEAIELVQNEARFDIAIVDFFLSDGHASPLLDELLLLSRPPDIVLMSGGNNQLPLEIINAIGRLSGATFFLQKPFSRSDLISAIGQET